MIATWLPTSISGVTSDTQIYLDGNRISNISEDVFRPLLEILSQGNGVLFIRGELNPPRSAIEPVRESFQCHPIRAADNPIECDCSLAWFISESNFMRSVRGRCKDRMHLDRLDLDCRKCSYECVSLQNVSLCTPGTITASKVDNCRPDEYCCQPKQEQPQKPGTSEDYCVHPVIMIIALDGSMSGYCVGFLGIWWSERIL